jgi:hypothetical protein
MASGVYSLAWSFRGEPAGAHPKTYLRLRRQYDDLRGRWVAGVTRFGI